MVCTATVSPKTMYCGDAAVHAGQLSCGVTGEPVSAKAISAPAIRSVSSRSYAVHTRVGRCQL